MLTDRFSEALCYCAGLHDGQTRKATPVPYLSHLLAVASLVLEHGGDEDEAIAALLHDAIEDQAEHHGGAEALRAEITARFGPGVTAIVDACTDAEVMPKPPWRERKERYIRHIRESGSPAVHRVSCADKLHNARAILLDFRSQGDALWDRFNVSDPDQHLWYYRSLVSAYRDAGHAPPGLVAELDRTVQELESLVAARTPG
jgi:(p)ppGpp synthase/HD superfamily hydrolase